MQRKHMHQYIIKYLTKPLSKRGDRRECGKRVDTGNVFLQHLHHLLDQMRRQR